MSRNPPIAVRILRATAKRLLSGRLETVSEIEQLRTCTSELSRNRSQVGLLADSGNHVSSPDDLSGNRVRRLQDLGAQGSLAGGVHLSIRGCRDGLVDLFEHVRQGGVRGGGGVVTVGETCRLS